MEFVDICRVVYNIKYIHYDINKIIKQKKQNKRLNGPVSLTWILPYSFIKLWSNEILKVFPINSNKIIYGFSG